MSAGESQLSFIIVTLMKGVMYRDDDPSSWQSLLALEARVHDFVGVLGLDLLVDDGEGFAYLRQRQNRDPSGGTAVGAPPRLVARRPLPYPVSLLLALLRKRLVEEDARSGDTRLIVSAEELMTMMRVFLAQSTNEARATDRLEATINKVVDLGFLRPLQGQAEHYEVRRILKAFVDAEWLNSFNERLAEYQAHATRIE
jgi:hypothetical protein